MLVAARGRIRGRGISEAWPDAAIYSSTAVTDRSTLETDYLVVGAGALGMAFADALIESSDAEVVMVDRRYRPGGHWLDSYPFVQLHQPSRFYGVNSTPLGQDRQVPEGKEEFYERSSGAEICGYFDEVMRHRLLSSGQVRFFPMCDYLGDHSFRSQVSGEVRDVVVRRRLVDATYMASRVPSCEPPPFEVGDGVRCVPVGELTRITNPPAGFFIIGGGKTAADAICWLLDQGTDPDRITWVRPCDAWYLNRGLLPACSGPNVRGDRSATSRPWSRRIRSRRSMNVSKTRESYSEPTGPSCRP